MHRTVAIHQPNFFPWLGYFDKIVRADRFVFLDDVQFQKTGGTWSNRVRLLVGGEARWVTAPVVRAFSGTRRVNEIELSPNDPWREKLLRTLESAYRRAHAYTETMRLLEPLIRNPEPMLAQYNMAAIRTMAGAIGIDPGRFVCSSQLAAEGTATARLVALVRAVGGTAYLCGGGAQSYQDDAAFHAAGLALVYQDFRHPVYPQAGGGAPITGLSIADALMNAGIDGTRKLLFSSDPGL